MTAHCAALDGVTPSRRHPRHKAMTPLPTRTAQPTLLGSATVRQAEA